MALYDTDLAMIQAASFGGHAALVTPWLIERLRGRTPAVHRILDVGCGAGVSSRTFLEAGFDVVGIDPSEALLEHARLLAPGATFVARSAYGEPLPRADAIAAIGEPLTYHAPGADADAVLAGFFQAAGSSLPAGGALCFDLIVAEGDPLDGRSFKSEGDWLVASETIEDRGARRLVRHVETFVREPESTAYRRRREAHHVRLFARDAVVESLHAAGFTLAEETRAVGSQALLPRRVLFIAISERGPS